MSNIRIPLNSRKYPGLFALIDEADYELVSQYKWSPNGQGYAQARMQRADGTWTVGLMHRLIMNPPDGTMVDHANGDKFDNTRRNLRLATGWQNPANSPGHKVGSTGLRGVHYRPRRGKWVAKFSHNDKPVNVGTFDDPLSAALAYDRAVVEARGEFAVTNKSLGLLVDHVIEKARRVDTTTKPCPTCGKPVLATLEWDFCSARCSLVSAWRGRGANGNA